MEELKPSFEAKYVREYGVHQFEAIDGTPITAISEPGWPKFCESFASLPQTGGYIVSPELITDPDKVLEIPEHKDEILDDIECAKEMSALQPHAYILLGTATFDNPFAQKPRNSLLILHRGKEVGRVNKRFLLSSSEQEVFEGDVSEAPTRLPKLGHAAIICSDLLMPSRYGMDSYGFINPVARTLLVSSKWASPLIDGMKVTDERFKNPLEIQVGQFFESFPNLQEIIMVDRAASETGLQPFNAHFKRAS